MSPIPMVLAESSDFLIGMVLVAIKFVKKGSLEFPRLVVRDPIDDKSSLDVFFSFNMLLI